MSKSRLFIFISVLLVGCGRGDTPELGNVEGKVTLEGSPLPNATVTFTPAGEKGGRDCSAVTDENGYYVLKYSAAHEGAPPGKYRVQITTATTTTDDNGNDVEVPEKLPAKYNVETELEKEVEPGSNTIDFALDSKGKVHRGEDRPDRKERAPDCS